MSAQNLQRKRNENACGIWCSFLTSPSATKRMPVKRVESFVALARLSLSLLLLCGGCACTNSAPTCDMQQKLQQQQPQTSVQTNKGISKHGMGIIMGNLMQTRKQVYGANMCERKSKENERQTRKWNNRSWALMCGSWAMCVRMRV